MMPGSWLARIGGRLLHADTYALMLSPAIADLQFEVPAQRAVRPSHYCAVLRAFTGALRFDISADLVSLTDDLPTIGVLTAIQGCYYSFMLVLLSGLGTERLSTVDVNGGLIPLILHYILAIGIVCVLTSSACSWPPRRTADSLPAD